MQNDQDAEFFLFLGYVGFLAFLLEGSARLAFSIPQVAKRLQANEDYTHRRNWVRDINSPGRKPTTHLTSMILPQDGDPSPISKT